MIICPQCGASNSEGVKFCDRCGQGLAGASERSATVAALPPLAVGTELKGGLRVLEVIGTTADENLYRAERQMPDGKVEHLQLREQIGPPPRDRQDLQPHLQGDQGAASAAVKLPGPIRRTLSPTTPSVSIVATESVLIRPRT